MDELGGRYRILSPLGAGGMGEVFLAEDSRLERRVAVKVLPESIQADHVARERLRREALAAAALDHPFICKVHEIGDANGRLFIVMEYVEGETLHAAARRGPMPIRDVLEIAHELAQALDTAHRRNIIHRDLKPANVMLTPQRHVKVMDFGLAKQLDVSKASASSGNGHGSDAGTTLTDAGSRLGTPAYMSPEQILGGALDSRSDIFSLGVMLHELAAGAHPFLKDDPSDTMAAILRDPPRPGPRDVETVGGLSAVINRMLSKACAGRHQTMQEVLTDLEGLRERAWSSSSRGAVATSAQPAERTPLVGRQAETAELERALDRMLTGHGSFVLIGGEPGVGKTRLVRELLTKARERGCMALTGHCYEMEGAPPFVPFVEIVEETIRLVPKAARAAMGEYAPEMSAMVPSLRRTYADIPPLPTDVPADQQRRLIFSAVLQYVQRGSQKSPGVLLFDDLHWADEPTLQLLLHFAPHLSSLRLLIVGTYRDVELDVHRPFAKTLESLLRQRLATRIALRRLNESAVQQMLSAMGGSAAPSGLAKAVFKETEGNPFFVEEVYQHLSEEGKLFDESGAWKSDLRVGTIEVPEGVRLVIGRRLDRLGDQARKVLTAAAVIGRTFPLDLLEAIVDVSQDDVLDAVEEADRAQLVSADNSTRTARYAFVHELIRTTLAGSLSMPRRQRLHLRIADAIEKLRASSLESHASVLAHHLYQAGASADPQRTGQALALSAARALAAGAFEEAIETTDNLLGLELPETDRLVAEAWEHRGYALAALARHDQAAAAFDKALSIHGTNRDDRGIERATVGGGASYFWRGFMSAGFDVVQRGLGLLSPAAVRERGILLSYAGAARTAPAHLEEAAGFIAEARKIAETLNDDDMLGRVLGFESVFHRMCCEYEAAAETGTRALGLLPANTRWDRANLLTNLSALYYYLGDLTQCEARLAELQRAAPASGHGAALLLHDQLAAMVGIMRNGDLRNGVVKLTELVKQPIFEYINWAGLGLCRLYLGDVAGALDGLQTAVRKAPPDNFFEGLVEGCLFAGHALAGDHERARRLLPTLTPLLPIPGRRNVQGAYYAADALVTGLAVLGERDQLGALYSLTLEHIKTGTLVAGLLPGPSCPQLAAALAADAAGLTERAREHFEIALRLSREVPVRILEPTVQYWYGRTLVGSDHSADRERGRVMVEAALNGFRSFEMTLHAALAELLLGSKGSEGSMSL
jgi:tetratricopeptide (TPR) repeat protein/predicted Ser/Thr protein kinase